jgi:hypothetical protein
MALAGLAGLAVGIVAGFVAREGMAPSEAPADVASDEAADAPSDLGAEVGRLRAEVSSQRALTSALQAELTRLRERVDELGPGSEPETDQAAGGEAQARAEARPGRPANGEWFEPGRLLALDMDPADIARIRREFDANQLEILFLRDRAVREGWMHQPRFANELETLRESLRQDAGDADYDAMLWATGRPNRVQLSSLLGGSPAIDAGLEDGDIVLRYDDQEIFDAQALLQATRGGEAGATVPLDVLRGDEEVRVYVPRGPLGAQLRPIRTPPRAE